MGQNKRVFRIVKDEIEVSSFRPSHMKDGNFFLLYLRSHEEQQVPFLQKEDWVHWKWRYVEKITEERASI